ncbi:hypothetical protein GCM10022404_18720 [Celeribacter arenosi]|uniref:Uncharacterized protein n=1 Tax=Celeribacter arenosi TaxID=792649 RepID=A0ABP7K7X1_9RHOB
MSDNETVHGLPVLRDAGGRERAAVNGAQAAGIAGGQEGEKKRGEG